MRSLPLSLAVATLLGLTTVLHASTITSLNETFNELNPTLDVTSAGAFSAINGTNVDIVGAGVFGFLCASPASGTCIDLDGTGGISEGQLESTSMFAAGTYNLSFDLIGSQRGSTAETTVTFGNYSHIFNLASSDITSGIVLNQAVTLTTPGYLLFASDDLPNDDIGDVLDNVAVAQTSSPGIIPEPSSLLLLGSGLVGLAAMARRRYLLD